MCGLLSVDEVPGTLGGLTDKCKMGSWAPGGYTNSYIRVLDTGSCVCKSNTPTLHSLDASIGAAVSPLLEERQDLGGGAADLVDPLLFPLVYGRSLVLAVEGTVQLHDVLESYKDATVAPSHFDRRTDFLKVQEQVEKCEFYRWSSNYQSLPCEVKYKDSGTEVQITSYTNNLHLMHKELYRAIEELMSLAIKPWNDCLIRGRNDWNDILNEGRFGPIPLRIITCGVEWEMSSPNGPSHLMSLRIKGKRGEERPRERRPRRPLVQREPEDFSDVISRGHMELPPPDSNLWQRAKEYLELPEDGSTTPVAAPDGWMEPPLGPWVNIIRKQSRLIRFRHPEPGTAFSYEAWKTGRHGDKAIIDMVRERKDWHHQPFKPVVPPHEPYSMALQDIFRNQGLQVNVKMDSIEFTPENLTYSGTNWQMEGQLNEHIVAVTVFTYDLHNITEYRAEPFQLM
ncbi:hypothetical protein BDV26DRAFT_293674 [Aspergillus bertholletiae]|uniref:DUF4246 domain-containing protein n=1 Tax=Aspergillus bertholletiae TaxID=1226010 RepID=A0A5N7B6L1_9EURO|nr:hypothetical protein BDV26DRAFT_293674 [Aspergillus bertholletiae]